MRREDAASDARARRTRQDARRRAFPTGRPARASSARPADGRCSTRRACVWRRRSGGGARRAALSGVQEPALSQYGDRCRAREARRGPRWRGRRAPAAAQSGARRSAARDREGESGAGERQRRSSTKLASPWARRARVGTANARAGDHVGERRATSAARERERAQPTGGWRRRRRAARSARGGAVRRAPRTSRSVAAARAAARHGDRRSRGARAATRARRAATTPAATRRARRRRRPRARRGGDRRAARLVLCACAKGATDGDPAQRPARSCGAPREREREIVGQAARRRHGSASVAVDSRRRSSRRRRSAASSAPGGEAAGSRGCAMGLRRRLVGRCTCRNRARCRSWAFGRRSLRSAGSRGQSALAADERPRVIGRRSQFGRSRSEPRGASLGDAARFAAARAVSSSRGASR